MVIVPAIGWRGGALRRVSMLGACGGLFFGIPAWLDSGLLVAGVVVFVVMGAASGVWMSRRMVRYWPGSRALSGPRREAVVAAARRGHRIDDDSLAPAVDDYRQALHAAADHGRPWRWLLVAVLIVGVGSTLWDTTHGSVGNAVASVIYLVVIGLELFYWPKRTEVLLANADRAATMAGQSTRD
jgi:hypothetical protein